MKRVLQAGFTLVELMIVIAIIGILAGALTFQVTKAADSARAMRCKVNLKNLTQAALSSSTEASEYPRAGSHECEVPSQRYGIEYAAPLAWVGWTGRRNENLQSSSPGKTGRFYGDSASLTDLAYQSITNGLLWSLTGRELKTYICDSHRKICQRNGISHVFRSYVMNAYFGYDYRANGATVAGWQRVFTKHLTKPGTRLMFAELPIYQPGDDIPHAELVRKDYDSSNPCWADSVLETPIGDDPETRGRYPDAREEYIGFNHLVAKRYVAHVSFADGHVEGLVEPRGASIDDLKELTEYLCNGEELDESIRKKMR